MHNIELPWRMMVLQLFKATNWSFLSRLTGIAPRTMRMWTLDIREPVPDFYGGMVIIQLFAKLYPQEYLTTVAPLLRQMIEPTASLEDALARLLQTGA